MSKYLILICSVFLLLITNCCNAALNLELTQGVDKAIPVAVVPFAGQPSHSATQTIVANIINTDLQNSGQFNVTYADDMNSAPHDMSAVNKSYWKSKNIDYVVVGKVTPLGASYKVQFQLINIYNNSLLIAQQFTVPASQLRALAHHISDLVYEQLTGIKGIFSTRIAYVLVQRPENSSPHYSLIVADADGNNPRALLRSPEPIMSPAWSPSGAQIAYVSFEHKRASIFLQNVATGARHVISHYPGVNGAPAWSPDGKKLAIVLTRTGYPNIYILDLASGNLQQLTSGPSLDTEPSWSPNGKSLIFTSNRGGHPQIYKIDLKTRNIQRVTYSGNYNARASFTPDGKSIVMLHRDDDTFNIAIQDLDSGRINILTNSDMNKSPSIAPNGQMIVYATNFSGRNILAEVSLDGNIKLRLPAPEGDVQEPAWSPFRSGKGY